MNSDKKELILRLRRIGIVDKGPFKNEKIPLIINIE